MSDFYHLKQIILNTVSRQEGSFAAGKNNFVDIAVNNALIFVQRKIDFEWCKGDVVINCKPFGNISQALDEDGKPTMVKRIIKAFGPNKPDQNRQISIPYLSRASQIQDDTNQNKHCVPVSCPRVIHQGQKVYFTPTELKEYDLHFYAVKWLPRLVQNEDTNFLLHYGFDYLMYRSILELNFFIKEDERFQVSMAMLGESYQSLLGWNAELVSITETECDL